MHTVNSKGERIPPCLTPLETPNFVEKVVFQRIDKNLIWYQEKRKLRMMGGRFLLSNSLSDRPDQKPCWHPESNYTQGTLYQFVGASMIKCRCMCVDMDA